MTPRALRVSRAAMALRGVGGPRDVTVVSLGGGAGVRVHKPVDENREYAERLRHDAVTCALEIVPGAFHGFDLWAPNAGVSRRFFESQCAALREPLRL